MSRRLIAFLAIVAIPACHALAGVPASAASTAAPPLRVVTDDNFPPYVYLDTHGKAVGYEVDLWKLWSRKTGRKVDFIATEWARAQAMLQSGQADAIDLMYRTPRRAATYAFTTSFATSTVSIFSTSILSGIDGPHALRGFQVGVERGDACAEHLHADGIGSLKFYPNYHAILDAVRAGDIQVFCMDDGPAYYYLYKDFPDLRFHKNFTYYHGHFRRAVLKGHARTLALIDRGMALITPAERDRLKHRWMGHPVSFTPYARIFAIALAVAMLMAALSGLWVHFLRRAVKRQTRQLHQRNAQLDSLVESSPDLIWMKDADGIYRVCNTRAAKTFGMPARSILGRRDEEVFQAEDNEAILDQDREVLREGVILTREISMPADHGHDERIFEAVKVPVRDDAGKIMGVLCTARDITDRKAATVALEQAAMVFEGMRDGVIVTDAELRILRVNRAFTRLTGYDEKDIAGRKPDFLDVQPDAASQYTRAWDEAADGGAWQGELWNRHLKGKIFPAWWSIRHVRDAQGSVSHVVAVFSDLQQIREYQSRIHTLTNYDLLTGLPNRALAMDRLDQAIRRASTAGRKAACLLLGLVNLTAVNDSMGHSTGDALLCFVAERLKQAVDPQQTLACIRGNKFAVIVEDKVQAMQLTALAERLIEVVSEPMYVDGHKIVARAGVGIVLYPDDGGDAETMARNMDAAMHKAKEQVHPKISFYNESISDSARDALHLDSALQRAIEEERFELFYQPQWSVASDTVSGVEALIRLRGPGGELVSPNQFLPFAEQSGLIVPIGRWALREACLQMAHWHKQGLPAIPVAVNVSARQLGRADFPREVQSALAESGLEPRWLHLEITEGQLLHRNQTIDQVLSRIHATGVRIAIDDFGTGYSSLSYLRHVPARVLKIDKSFIDDIPGDPDAVRIVAAIISMAHSLRMKVVAEGVEHAAQADTLARLGCDERQGYLDSPPLPAGQLLDRIATRT